MGERLAKATNEQVWTFYLDKPEANEGASAYLATVGENAGSNAYIGLYDDFRILADGSSERLSDPEDGGFYEWLRSRPMVDLCPPGVTIPSESELANPGWAVNPATFPNKNKSGRPIPSPKWHLYVSYFALKAYWGRTGRERWDWERPFDGSAIRNKALLLWMAEGADLPVKEGVPSLRRILDAITARGGLA